jgi:hypothetical protein
MKQDLINLQRSSTKNVILQKVFDHLKAPMSKCLIYTALADTSPQIRAHRNGDTDTIETVSEQLLCEISRLCGFSPTKMKIS